LFEESFQAKVAFIIIVRKIWKFEDETREKVRVAIGHKARPKIPTD
jgi:hypothetical protein